MATNTTATSQNHNGTGSQNNFAISFAFLANTEVDVTVGGVLKTLGTHYNIVGSEVQFTSGNTPPSGTGNVKFTRDTDISAKKVDFADGSVLTETDLDNNSDQILFAQQEMQNKLSGIEEGATADQTAAEIRTLTESASDSNVFTDADHSKLNAIEAGATADQTASEIRTLVESASDSNVFTDADHSKLNGIESGATADQNASEIRTLVESATDSNVFTDADHTKLNNAVTLTDTQTLTNKTLTTPVINDLSGSAVVTSGTSTSDNKVYSAKRAGEIFYGKDTVEEIQSGETWSSADNKVATTAAIDARIIDLIDDVGGFDIIANEQSFPNTNPQGTTGQAAVISIKAVTTNLVPSGTTVTIANGNLANNQTITITGVTSTIPSGFGILVESTSTTHTYSFHRLVPKATEVTTVASKATEIGRLGTADAVADMAILGTADVVADMNTLGTADVVSDMNTLATTDVVNDMNTLATSSVLNNIDTVVTNVSNVNNVGSNIAKVNSVAAVVGGTQTFTVTVQNVSGSNYFFIDGQQAPTLTLARGFTYTFDVSDSSNSGHPLRFKDGSGNSYTTGVTTNGTQGQSGATVVIAVAANAPSSLRYYCTVHGNGMGNTITVTDDNIGTVAGSIANVNTTAGAIANVNNVGNSISNVNTVASNISSVNSFFNTYRIGSSNPTSSLDVGDLFFNTTSNSLKVYTGSAWVDGVTTTGNFALKTGNTFTGSNIYNDNVKALFGTGSDLEIFHDGNFSRIKDVGTGDLVLQSNTISFVNAADSETVAQFKENGSVDLYYDNSKKFETTSYGVLSNQALKVNGNFLELNNNADVQLTLNKAGTQLFSVRNNSTAAVHINTQNSAILALGVSTGTNNGSVESHLQILAGGNVRIPNDSGKLQLGASQDLQIYHDGTNSYINDSGTGVLRYLSNTHYFANSALSELQAQFIENGAVNLYYDGSKKLETTSYGNASAGQVRVTSSNASTVAFSVGDVGTGFYNAGSNAIGYSANGTQKWNIDSGGNLRLVDSVKAYFGTSDDLQIFHDGSNSYIKDSGTGDLLIGGDANVSIINSAASEFKAKFITNGAVELYHDNSKKFETTSTGATFSGTSGSHTEINILGYENKDARLNLSADEGDDNADKWRMVASVDGNFYLQNYTSGSWEWNLRATGNAAVELYYDHTKKFETLSNGASVTGDFLGVGTTSKSGYSDRIICVNRDAGSGIELRNNAASTGQISFSRTSNATSDAYRGYIQYAHSTDTMLFGTVSSPRVEITSNGHLQPHTNNTYDLGTSSKRWRNVYTNDLNLSNEGGANDVDGTWGSYTIQEGAEDLFLINKRNGKKYKFNLTEVS